MKTLQLLQNISRSISSNSGNLSREEWRDIILCVKQEFLIRPAIFDPEHLHSVEEYLDSLLNPPACFDILCDPQTLRAHLFELIGMVRALPDIEIYDENRQKSLFDHAALNHYREDTTVVLGDSHVNFFSGSEHLDFYPIGNNINICPSENRFSVLYYGSCLAYTCTNPDSSTGFRRKTGYLLDHFIRPGARLLVSLGEIDLRIHVYQQSERQGRDYKEIIDDILANYLTCLCSLKERGYHVYCWGPIASQKDDSPINPKFPRVGSETERNRATEYFNERLEKLCSEKGLGFVSIFPQMITSEYRTKGEYLSDDYFHLSQRAMELAEPVLRSAGLLP